MVTPEARMSESYVDASSSERTGSPHGVASGSTFGTKLPQRSERGPQLGGK
jgi:hypothetical protein